jgi:pectinesterase
VCLVGENRDSTIIVYAELRSNWTKARDNRPDGSLDDEDWGSAVINIGDGVTDVTIANLTIHNNYGSLYGSQAHQFTIRGFKATRVAILHCTVKSDGGDAVSLWNRESGMYYHSDCSFEGWVEYVCPRGWCYISDSRFYGHNRSASIWHDGSANKDQKFVIRNSYFDGVSEFPLGRHHRDAQLYLVDCTFSENMADKPIYAPTSPNTVPWQWGARHYFYNCRREGGNFDWFANNLHEAEGSPAPEEITARWTFGGKWDPESELPSILPFAALPQPGKDRTDVSHETVSLRWIPARNASEQLVHFGESVNPPLVSRQHESVFFPDSLQPSTSYYWRVDTVVGSDTTRGSIWKFRTRRSNGSK